MLRIIDNWLGSFDWYRQVRGGYWKLIPQDKMSKDWIRRQL